MDKRVQILDCTLRDGGTGLQDAFARGQRYFELSPQLTSNFTNHLSRANIDIIELGTINPTQQEPQERFGTYKRLEDISKHRTQQSHSHFAALYHGSNTPLSAIPDWDNDLCDIIRVVLNKNKLKESLDFCAALVQKGYRVCIQPMLTMLYSDTEVTFMLEAANAMSAYAVYFVDTFGYMREADIIRFRDIYDRSLNPSIKIGFHGHNHLNLAFANALQFLQRTITRNVIIDACILGLGQGAGNLQTELLAYELNQNWDCQYDYEAILDACEVLQPYFVENVCGYSIINLLSAIHKASYKYAAELRKYNLSFAHIHRILTQMPPEVKNTFSPVRVQLFLKELGKR